MCFEALGVCVVLYTYIVKGWRDRSVFRCTARRAGAGGEGGGGGRKRRMVLMMVMMMMTMMTTMIKKGGGRKRRKEGEMGRVSRRKRMKTSVEEG